jgi:hypothetical protein
MRTMTIALALAGVAMLASPSFAGPKAKWTGPGYGGPFAASNAYAQGARGLNQNGVPYRSPPACAYPQGYDSGGNAVFNRQNCRLP